VTRRILLLNTDLEIGGTPTVVRELAIRLHRPPGACVEVACLAAWGPVADQLVAAGISVSALGARGAADLRVVRRLIDLIHTRSFDTVLSFLLHANAAAAAAKPLCPGVRFLQSIQTTQPTPAWHWRLQRLIHRAADKILVHSPSVGQVAQQWAGVPADKIAIISNAIDPSAFDPSPIPSQDPRPYPIGFIGRLDPVKRVGDLLEAMAAQPPTLVHLHIFGDGAERGAVEQRIRELGIGDAVTLHGAVPRPQEALSQIGLLVLPSINEGFGLVLIEAMAAGVPVVARDVPGVRDVVRDGQTGVLVQSLDVTSLAAAIARLVGDPALRRRLIECGRREVIEHYSWPKVLAQYRKLLEIPADI
jgi:glycosyltransferase involved in cell wall biosynthesis